MMAGRRPVATQLQAIFNQNYDMLLSIFNPKAPSHDGAVIVADDVITRMGAFLPLSSNAELPSGLGSRHRAAIGISEASDAVALVVSEERGQVSLAVGGRLEAVESPEGLEERLAALVKTKVEIPRSGWETAKGLVMDNWPVKLGAFGVVLLTWLVLAGQQNYQVTLEAAVNFQNLEAGLGVGELSDRLVQVTITGPRRVASSVRADEIKVVVPLKDMEPGGHQIGLIRQNIQVPLGLEVVGVNPKVLRVVIQRR